MIRPTVPADLSGLLALAAATGLFPSDQLAALQAMLVNYFNDGEDGDRFWLTDDDGEPVGVAYCEPERMTDDTWNLLLIAIHPERQRQGRGTALIQYVEDLLASHGARILLVETSSLPDFEATRAFYRKCGFEEEARIRDYYSSGEDKIVYRKVLKSI